MTVKYKVDLSQISGHWIAVEVTFVATQACQVSMAAWCPGSYMIRDYSRFVSDLEAKVGGVEVASRKIDKQTWTIDAEEGQTVVVSYKLYGRDLTVRTNHFDDSHAFMHSPATFVVPQQSNGPFELSFAGVPADWHIVTGLELRGRSYHTATLDEFMDCPIHVGGDKPTQTTAAGKPMSVQLWGEREPFSYVSRKQFVSDLKLIVDKQASRFSNVPYENYDFVLMQFENGYGGLEHRNSSINIHGLKAFADRGAYLELMELLSHEYYHTWNGKRLAPKALLNFDYSQEAYTKCLWVMEGITSYYDRLTLLQVGMMNPKEYCAKLANEWMRLQSQPGRFRQSLEESSFDSWIKLYKAHESNINTTISYYLKGSLVAFALDLTLRAGGSSLDAVVSAMWNKWGAEMQPYPEDLSGFFSEVSGVDLSDFFARYIQGTEDPPLPELLNMLGLSLKEKWHDGTGLTDEPSIWLGVTLRGESVQTVREDSPSFGLLSPGDQLVALDGMRIKSGTLRERLQSRTDSKSLEIHVFRRGRLVVVEVPCARSPATRYQIVGTKNDNFTLWSGGQSAEGVSSVSKSPSWF